MNYQLLADQLKAEKYDEHEMRQIDFEQVKKDLMHNPSDSLIRFLINFTALVDDAPMLPFIPLILSFPNMHIVSLFYFNLYIKLDAVAWIQDIKSFLLAVDNTYTNELLLYCKLEEGDVSDGLVDRVVLQLDDLQKRDDFLQFLMQISLVHPSSYMFTSFFNWVYFNNIVITKVIHCIFVNISLKFNDLASFKLFKQFVLLKPKKLVKQDSKVNNLTLDWGLATLLVLSNNFITDESENVQMFQEMSPELPKLYEVVSQYWNEINECFINDNVVLESIDLSNFNFIQSWFKFVNTLSLKHKVDFMPTEYQVVKCSKYLHQLVASLHSNEQSPTLQQELIKCMKYLDMLGDVFKYAQRIKVDVPYLHGLFASFESKEIPDLPEWKETEWIESFEKCLYEGARIVGNPIARGLLRTSRFEILREIGGDAAPVNLNEFVLYLISK